LADELGWGPAFGCNRKPNSNRFVSDRNPEITVVCGEPTAVGAAAMETGAAPGAGIPVTAGTTTPVAGTNVEPVDGVGNVTTIGGTGGSGAVGTTTAGVAAAYVGAAACGPGTIGGIVDPTTWGTGGAPAEGTAGTVVTTVWPVATAGCGTTATGVTAVGRASTGSTRAMSRRVVLHPIAPNKTTIPATAILNRIARRAVSGSLPRGCRLGT
jgi:hypothetical protein